MTDCSKAFDTIAYEILIAKLHRLNFSKQALQLMVSYLYNRYQYVRSVDQSSGFPLVTNGVHMEAS